MGLSKTNKTLLWAHKRGYRVDKSGKVSGIKVNKRKLSKNGEGYLKFSLSKTKGIIYVHRLQAYQKFGDKILEEEIEVRHLNNDKTDNSWNNIVIGTRSDNIMDRPKEVREKCALKAGLENSSLTEKDVKRIRKLREEREWTYSQILDEYNIAKSTLSYICNYKTWTHI